MKQILLLSRVNTTNLGDQLIGRSMMTLFSPYGEITQDDISSSDKSNIIRCDELISKYSGSNINNLSYPPKKTKWGVYIIRCLQKKIHFKIKNIKWLKSNYSIFTVAIKKKFDIIVIGGGELISPSFAFPIYIWSLIIKYLQRKSKLVLYGVGVTECTNIKERRRLARIVNLADSVYVRDKLSRNYMKKLYNRDSKEISDVAFINDFDFSGERIYSLYGMTTIERINKHNILQLSENEYFEYTYNELCQLTKIDEYKLFYTTKEDCEVCAKFSKYCQINHGRSFDIVRVKDLDSLIAKVQKANVVFSPRMHGCILAQLSGGDVHPILISSKMKSYKDKYLKEFNILQAKTNLIETVSNILV